MASGELVQGQCIPSTSKVDVVLSHLLPGASQQGADSYTWWFYKANPTDIGKMTFKNGLFFQNMSFSVAQYPACDTTETFTDGMALGWAVAAAMVVVYVIRRPYR